MRVLLISPKYVTPTAPPRQRDNGESFGKGGLGLHVGRLAQLLKQHGCAVTVLTYSPTICGVVEEDGIRVWRLSLLSTDHHPEDPSSLRVLREQYASSVERIIMNERHIPAIVHCHHHTGFPMALDVKRKTGCPIVSTFHYLLADSSSIDHGSVSDTTKAGERRVCDESDRLIAVSHWLQDAIMRNFSVSKEFIDVIHHGVPTVTCESPATVEQFRARFAPRDEKIFTFIGRLSSEKGIRPLLESARRVLEKHTDVAYVVAGGTSAEVIAFRQEIQSDPVLNGRVHFLGWTEEQELAVLRSASYAVIVPSLYESFGYSAAEALAAAVPVIASNAGGLPEIVVDGACGLVVNLETKNGETTLSPSALALAQVRLLTERGLREQLVCGCQPRAAMYFSNEAMLKATLNTYHRAITTVES